MRMEAKIAKLRRLREARVNAARSALGLAAENERKRAETAERAVAEQEVAAKVADAYVANEIREIKALPIEDGASVFASIVFGSREARRQAANTTVGRQLAEARLEKAADARHETARRLIATMADAEVVNRLGKRLHREGQRKAERQQDDRQAELAGSHPRKGDAHGQA